VIYVLYFVHIVTCFFLILVVLLQQGKGADLSVFGGGATQSAFGARGATQLIHKLTVASFVIFVFTTIGISLLQNRSGAVSVMDGGTTDEVEAVEEAPVTDEAVPDGAADVSVAPEADAASDAPAGPETESFEEPPATDQEPPATDDEAQGQ
jgi:preprotein translocase subunit SecG